MVYFCMSTESLNKISSSEINESQNPIRKVELPPRRANMDVLKKRLLLDKKKEKKKMTIIVSTLVVSLGALTVLTY